MLSRIFLKIKGSFIGRFLNRVKFVVLFGLIIFGLFLSHYWASIYDFGVSGACGPMFTIPVLNLIIMIIINIGTVLVIGFFIIREFGGKNVKKDG